MVMCPAFTVVETMKIFFFMSSSLSPLFSANFICFRIYFVTKMLAIFLPSTMSSKSSSLSSSTAFWYAYSTGICYPPKNYPSSSFSRSISFFFMLISNSGSSLSSFYCTTSASNACWTICSSGLYPGGCFAYFRIPLM